MAESKKKRDKPCKPRGVDSKGLRKARKHPLTKLEKVLAGKGQYQSFKPVECKAPWRGVSEFRVPFDAEQAEENKRLYPHLFEGSFR